MKGLLWVLALFALAAGIALFGHFGDAYVLLVAPPYRVELALNVAIAIGAAFFFVIYLLLRFIALTGALPQRFREFFLRRKSEKSLDTFDEAFRLFLEGNFKKALKKAAAAHDAGYSPAISALLAARSARRLRDAESLEKWLSKAREADAKTQSAALMIETEMQLDLEKYDEASQTLGHLRNISPSPPETALWLDLRAQRGLGNPDEILRVARLLEKYAVPVPDALEVSGSLTDVKAAAHLENMRKRSSDAPKLQMYWKAIPKSETVPALTEAYCAALLALGVTEDVRKIIETRLENEWHSGLAALYGSIPDSGDLSARLAQAEKWLPHHGDEFRLLLTLGRMAREIDPNKAKIYLNAALARRDDRDARLELARIEEAEGSLEEALEQYRRAAVTPLSGQECV
ncbi:MAG: hypothetical protein LBD67_06855 [Candidatus Accumulibacter sp.]|jgi:HemY protein|nr:hypothetical protein [Accumulibacter sp.]